MNKWILILGIFLIVVFASGCTKPDDTKNNISEIKITNPVNNTNVPQFYTVSGTCVLKPGEKIEILIKPEGYEWWTQEDPTITNNSTWQVRAQFGTPTDTGMSFRVLAIVTKNDINTGIMGNSTPTNITVSDEIIVRRQ